jgi:hypothetical protein
MPIRWKILPAERLVVAAAEGPVGLADVETYLDALVVADAQPYAKLFDASTMDFRITDDELMLLGARMRAYDGAFPAGPLALVVTTPEIESWARRFINLSGMRRPAELFATVAAAKVWLEEQKG